MIRENDMILADGQYYSMNCYETKRNNNVLVVGTSGSGKSRSIVSPNILQATGSYIISDPKGKLYGEYGEYLRKKGYLVELLDFDEPKRSVHYNFFEYIHSEKDILKVAHMLVYQDEHGSLNDPFWDRSAELLLVSIMGYLYYERPKHEQTLECILKLVSACQIEEENAAGICALDRIMEEVGAQNPHHFAYRQYQKFRLAAARTLKSVLITVTSLLGKFDIDELNEMMADDELELMTIGERKTAVFVVVSDTDRSMDNLANLFFSQAMNELCRHADKNCADARLPVDVRFILDDFATNCRINEFPRMISAIRSRGISTMLMIQAESQLRAAYGEDAATIIANCDTYVYLGGNDIETAKAVAIRCNVPVQKILYMPVETNWIFRRGQTPVNGKNFDLDSFALEKRNHVMVAEKKMKCYDLTKEGEPVI